MERRKGNLVFPTSVYLDNLASSVSQSSSRSQASSGASSPSVSGGERGAVNMFEVSQLQYYKFNIISVVPCYPALNTVETLSVNTLLTSL